MSVLVNVYCWPEESPSSVTRRHGEKYQEAGAVCNPVFKSFPVGKDLSYFSLQTASLINEPSVDEI